MSAFEVDITTNKIEFGQSVQKMKELIEALSDRVGNIDFLVGDGEERIVSLEQKNKEQKWRIKSMLGLAWSMRDNLLFLGRDDRGNRQDGGVILQISAEEAAYEYKIWDAR